LVGHPADLVDAPGHRRGLGAEALLDRRLDALGQRAFELRGGGGELLDLGTGPLERGFEVRLLWPTLGGLRDPLLSALDRAFIHRVRRYLVGRMKSVELEYELPPELIAQHPAD